MTAAVHPMTEPEAHAVCTALAADEHIPVHIAITADRVHIWPDRELTVLEEVTTLRAVAARTDSRIDWHERTPA